METNKLPTAEYWIKNEMNIIDVQEAAKKLIEFAKLHVQEALRQASEKAKIVDTGVTDSYFDAAIDKESILNAYNLDNIK